jgi:hypothetical protein
MKPISRSGSSVIPEWWGSTTNYRVGPRGGVYTVDFDGTRHYLDREQARRYIAELTAKRSSAGTATKSRLVSINPGDKDYGERSSPVVSDEVSTASLWLTGGIFFSVLSIFVGCFFEHPFWLLGLTFQLLKVLYLCVVAVVFIFSQLSDAIGHALWHALLHFLGM